MRLLYILLGVSALTVLTLVAGQHYYCGMLGKCDEQTTQTDTTDNAIPEEFDAAMNRAPISRTNDLSIVIGDSVLLENREQFAFMQNMSSPEMTPDNEGVITAIADFLKANPNAKVEITGAYMANEADTAKSMFENLGISRAGLIRDLLQAEGIPDGRLSLKATTAADLSKPITFSGELETSPDSYDKFEGAAYTFTNMVFSDINFEFDSWEFNPRSSFLVYADSVAQYFKLNPEQKMTIIGHTDNTGRPKYNSHLGRERAKAVKTYFVEQHQIDESRIRARTSGEEKPIAPNDTEENKARNRRVNLKIHSIEFWKVVK